MGCRLNRPLTPNKSYGVPNPRYIRPIVRINGLVQDMPFGYKFNPCWLPMDAIAEATNQELSWNPATGTLSLSDGGGSVALSSLANLTITQALTLSPAALATLKTQLGL